ncbi:hypothetical protein BLNAU_1015 [Blattamonas nauphoetae]|uniref:Protein kinase domain-containing protein n=1 Tax=Blattamonas nauphoetae TaxID=2049346 RepID=A0ABQ9YJN0_9EUKA|nr:hypothetical protein BLNAU_1015 [Blattamonas nauphoetae]
MHFLVLLLFFTSFTSHPVHARTLVESQTNSSPSNQREDFASVHAAQSLDVFLTQATNIQRSAPVYLNEQIYTCGCIDVQSPLQIVGAKNCQLISPTDVLPQEMFQVSNTTLIIESATLMPNKEVARAVNSNIHLEFVTIASHTSESLVISLNSHVTLCSIDFKHPKSHAGMVSLVRSEDNSGSVILASSSLNNGILRSSEPLVASSCTPSTQIAWSSFSNISVPTNVNTRPLINSIGKTRMVGCRTESVHSVHDGTITSPINGPGSFIFTNNSFANTDRSNAVHKYTEGDYTSFLTPSEDDVLFHNCHFKNCESSSRLWGGAIFSQQGGQKVSITHSSFTSCSCSTTKGAGGAIFLINTTSSISDTLFKDCRSFFGAAAGFHAHENTLSFCSNNCTGGVAERESTVTTDLSKLSQVFSGNRFEDNEALDRACFATVVSTTEISHNLFKGNTHTHPELCRSTLEIFFSNISSVKSYANKFEENGFTATTCNGTISSDVGFIFWNLNEFTLFPKVTEDQIFFPSSAQSDTPITPLETANVIVYGLVNADQSFQETYKADEDSPSPYVQFSRPTTLFLSRRKYDFSAKAISFGAFSGNAKVIIENIQITPNTTALSTDFVSLSTASLIVDKIALDSLPVGSFSFIRMTGESSLVVSSSNFTNFAQTNGAGGSFLVMDGSAAQHTSISSTMFSSLSSTGNGGVILATLTTESTLTVDTCVFFSCSSGGNGGAISVSCAAGVPSSSLVIKSAFTSCTCGSGQKGEWVFVEGYSFRTLLERTNWLSTVSSLVTPTDDNLLWGTDKSELEEWKYRSMTLLYYLLPFRHVTIHSSSDGRDEDGCGRSEWECKSLEMGASHLSGSGSHKLIVAVSTTLTTPLSFSTNAIEICPTDATASITTGATGKLAVSALTLTLTSISFDGQSVERSSSLLEITGSGWIVVSGCSFSSFVKDGDGSIFSSSLNSGNSLTFENSNFSSCSSSGRGGALAVTLNGGSFSMVAPISFELCSSTPNEGDWISITSADLVAFLSSSLTSLKPAAQTSPYSSLEKKKWFGGDTNGTKGSLLFFWYPHTSTEQSTHIHADGEDHALCGRESLPCSSFNKTLSHRNANNTFIVDSGMTLKEELTIVADTILTSSTSKQTITTTSDASITIGQKSLSLVDLSLIGSSRSTSFISLLSSGTLILDSCLFSSFSNIQSDGSVLSAVLGSTSKLEISDCSFEKCKSAGNGGVIFVDVCSLTTPSNFVLSSLSFGDAGTTEANLCGEGKLGQNIYVVSLPTQRPSLKTIFGSVLPLKPANDAGFFSSSEMNRMEFGEKSNDAVSGIGSLLFVVFSYDGGDLTVDESSAITHSLCGHSFLPCSSLSGGYCFVKKLGETDGRLLVRGGVSLDTTITTTAKTVTMTSTSEVETVSMGSGKHLWICGGSLTVSSLAFVNASESFDDSLFVLSGFGSLSLSGCSFTGFSSSVKGSVISGDVGGGLEVSECSFVSCSSTQNEGDCISITSANLVTFLSSSLASLKPAAQTSPYSRLEKKKWFGVDALTSSEGSLLFYWYPHKSSSGAVHVHKDGEDHVLCGVTELPCSLLSSSFSKSHSTATVIDSDLEFNEVISNIASPHSLSSTISNEITVDTDASFVVSSSSLSVQTCSFVSKGTQRTSSFLTVTGSGSARLTSCKFSLFSSTEGGSVVSGTIKTGSSLIVDGCTFTSCVSKGKGGVIAVSLEGTGTIETKNTNTFETCSSETGEGNWISISSAALVLFLSSSLASLKPAAQTSPYSSLEKKRWFGVDALTSSEASLLFYWYPHTSAEESTHIHADGDDHALCGRESLPCSSFNKTLSHQNANNTFIVDSGMTLKEGLIIAADTILTSSASKQTITTTSAASFSIGQSSLTLLDLSFLGSSRPSSFISLSSASSVLVVNDCSFSSFTLPTALFDFAAGSLSLSSTKFHQIARSDGNGSVLEVEMVEGMELEIDDVELSDVTTQNGVANGFFISFTTISDQSKIPAFSLHNLNYSSSSSSNSNGAFVWIEGNNLDEWIAYGDPRFAGSFETGVSFEWLWSVDHATSLKASLLFYLIAGSGAIGVASDGLDLVKCGHNSVWCRTLEHSLTRALTVLTNQLHVMREVSVQNSVEMGGVTVKGLPVMSSIVLSSSGCLREETGDTVQFESVTVVLKEGGRSSAALVVLFGHMNLSMVEISVLTDQTTPLFKSVDSILTLQTITISSSHNVGTLMDCEKGTVSVNSLESANISFSSTPIRLSDLRSATLIQLQVSNTSDVVFMECSTISKLSLQSCSFEGVKHASHNEEEESLCEWTTGLISISDSTVSIKNSDFTHLSQGALFLSNTTTSIYLTSFSNNIVGNSRFPSARKNIRCEGGEVVVDSLNGGDGSKDLPSAWISVDSECVFSSPVLEPSAVFFVPTLTSSESPASFSKASQQYSLTITGSLLMDCHLRLEVFSVDEKKVEKGSIPMLLSASNTMNWTESSFSTQLASSALSSLDSKMEWRCRIVFGDGFATDSTLVKRSASDERKAQFASVRKWLIPVIIASSVLLLLFFIILIIILVRRRNKQKKGQEQQKARTEMDEQLPVEKFDVYESFAPTLLNTTANMQKVNQNEFDEGAGPAPDTQPHGMERGKPVENEGKFEAVNLSDVSEKVVVNWKDTLYRRLHSGPNRMIGAERATIAQQLARGLLNLAQKDASSLGLRNVSPHWIVFDWTNQMYLQTGEVKKGEDMTGSVTRNTKEDSAGVEGQRWIAPELMDSESHKKHDHGAVFSLGLILWELETGVVPFGELDAANAHRQLGCGGQLSMTKISSPKLVSLIEKCLDLDPTCRPTLAEVSKELGEDGLFASGTILQDDPLGCDF